MAFLHVKFLAATVVGAALIAEGKGFAMDGAPTRKQGEPGVEEADGDGHDCNDVSGEGLDIVVSSLNLLHVVPYVVKLAWGFFGG